MTKIIGWDVGIKNLAYCIINKNNETNTFTIEQWKIIDLTDNVDYYCCGLLKKKKGDKEEKQCDKTAKFYTESNDKTKYYCATHKKQHNVNTEEIEASYVKQIDNPDKQLCQHITPKNNKQCIKKANYLFNNQLCCKTHKEMQLKNKIKEVSIKPIKKNKTYADTQTLCEKMYNKLSEINDLETIDEVYIENQPTHINPVMKTVSAMLFSYFVYIFKSNKLSNKIIKFVSPSFKIEINKELIEFTNNKINQHNNTKSKECKCRICKLNTDLITNKEKLNENYKEYKLSYEGIKELGIIYTEKILEINHKGAIDMIKDYDKKDDLCDAFLHGYRKIKN